MKDERFGKGGNGRDDHGWFIKGCRAGPGNPHLRRVHRWRKAIAEALTEQQIADLIRKLYDEAMAGNVAAAREVLDRVCGKPVQPTAHEPDDGERHPIRITFALPEGDGQTS